ncbi:ribonuclease HI [Terasakiella pusilla]|uniref:ribonuclease HI n=1 Tax=Terasakiella pusilla TaxID=64973 RepID=UPI003AA86B6A
MENVTIYTDGSCSGNPGPGGWGAVLLKDEQRREIRGGESDTTNNRMELMAAIRALEWLKRPYAVTIYTDSAYVKNGITTWIAKWKKNGWRGSNRNSIKNIELWLRLDKLCSKYNVTWKWVKGHSGNSGNERTDALAKLGMQPFIRN